MNPGEKRAEFEIEGLEAKPFGDREFMVQMNSIVENYRIESATTVRLVKKST